MILDILRKRRSKRKYSQQTIPQDIIDRILETALRAPSSRGKRPWEFHIITNADILEKLSEAKEHGSAFLKDAPMAIAVSADPAICDVWVEDTSIAAILIQVAAEEMGLGSCWIQLRKRKQANGTDSETYAKDILGITANKRVPFIIAMGYSEQDLPPVPKEDLLYKKINYIKD